MNHLKMTLNRAKHSNPLATTDFAVFLINHQIIDQNIYHLFNMAAFLLKRLEWCQCRGRSNSDAHGKMSPLAREIMTDIWKPSVTVAAIVERDNRFLLVEEETSDGIRLNQPAGHLEPRESLIQAVVRETLEESAHDFSPTALVGMYMSRYLSSRTGQEVTYLRFAFTGELGAAYDQPLDDGILRIVWMSYVELIACQERHRSPLVLQCIQDYLDDKRTPLSLLYTDPSVPGALHA
jgi:8-oxo-dGTP pyrophosphatase MutT (NUDIX family)